MSQHNAFTHPQQYGHDASWLQQPQSTAHGRNSAAPAHLHAHNMLQPQQQSYNRLNMGGGMNLGLDHGMGLAISEGHFVEENRRVLSWVAELLNGSSRETALMELSKKREQVPELALIIWHSFGAWPF